jgi:hypothetical protein
MVSHKYSSINFHNVRKAILLLNRNIFPLWLACQKDTSTPVNDPTVYCATFRSKSKVFRCAYITFETTLSLSSISRVGHNNIPNTLAMQQVSPLQQWEWRRGQTTHSSSESLPASDELISPHAERSAPRTQFAVISVPLQGRHKIMSIQTIWFEWINCLVWQSVRVLLYY